VDRPEADLLLLAVRLNQKLIADALPVYPSRGSVVIPFGELCRLLDLAITVDVAKGTAEGFFITSNRRFLLDASGRRVVVEGASKSFDPAAVEVHHDDIYVDAQAIGQWLPLDITVDLYASLLTVRPHEPLPLQRQQEREARVQKDLASLGLGGPKYPSIENRYRLFDGPFLDETTRLTWQPNGRGGHRAGIQASLLATGDLLSHEGSAYLFVTDQGGVTDWRLALGRKDPDGRLLGPLRAKEYGIGEVLYPGLDFVSLPASGPGFLVSNFPLERQTQFDRQTFRGELPSGWQVELYQNGALIAFQQSRPDGLYEFNNVALLFGLNLFRLVFYGPFGEQREERHRFNVGESLTPAGQLFYRFVGNDPRTTGQRGHFELDYGITSRISATGGYGRVDLPDGRREFGRLGLRGFWDVLFAHADFVTDWRGGTLADGGLQTRLGPIGLFAEHAELSGFESEVFRPVFGEIKSRTTVRLDTTVPTTAVLPAIPVTFEYKEDRLTSGLSVREFDNRIATAHGGFAVSNFLTWTTFHGGATPAPEPIAIGDFLVSKFLRQFALRGEVVYNLKPRAQFSNAVLTAETRIFPQYLVQAGVNYIVQARQTQYLASVTRAEGPFGFGANLTYANHGAGFSGALTFNISVARDPRGPLRTQARPLAGAGAASTFVYLDANGNGVFDPGEKPLEGVGFKVSRGAAPVKTGADGRAFLLNLPSYHDTDVGIALGTLEDPLAVPAREGVRFVPRAGKATVVDFPIIISGEVTGTIFVRRHGATQPGAGVELQLLDERSDVVKSVRSAFDGFYDITGIAPGRYRLLAAPTQMERLDLSAPLPREIVIAPSGTILDGVDLVIEAR
jgi:hypothetical protein